MVGNTGKSQDLLRNTGFSGKFNFQDNQTVKLDLNDTRLYSSINYGPCRVKLLQLKICSIGFCIGVVYLKQCIVCHL